MQLQYELELAVSARSRDASVTAPARLALNNLVSHLQLRKKLVLHIEADKSWEIEGRNVDLCYSGGTLLETLMSVLTSVFETRKGR